MTNQSHHHPYLGGVALLLTAAALLLVAWSVAAAPAAPAGPVDRDPATLIPLGPDQGDTYRAYRALFDHLGHEGRLRWVQTAFTHDGADYAPGTALVPEAELTGPFDHALVPSGTLDLRPAYAVAPLRVALFRSSVTDTYGDVNWELAAVREVFANYLWGAVPNDVLTEDAIRAGELADYDLLVLPSIKVGTATTVTQALGPEGLAAIETFVRSGGHLYAQGEAARIVQATNLVPPDTVDPFRRIDAPGNTARLDIALPDHPLAMSWLTDTLYVLGDPRLTASADLPAVASFADGSWPGTAAILSGLVDQGRVTLVAGHPTDRHRREQLPLFLDALLLSGAEYGELYGRAAQTYNPALPPNLLPAWEPVPISVTLSLANLGEDTLYEVLVTETVEPGFIVTESTISPPPLAVSHEVLPGPLTRTLIIWDLGDVDPGQVELAYQARTAPESLAQGENILFSAGQADYWDENDRHVTVRHFPFRLSSQMAARLEGDRDIELDRAYTIPAEGNAFDIAAVLENKEWTAARQVVITDVVALIAPIVALDNQYRVLATDDGETVWMRNEVYFYDDDRYPLPVGYTLSDTITLADWDGVTVYTYTSPGGYHTDPPLHRPITDTGSFITIPPTYSAYITVTADHQLVLPAVVLTWTAYYTSGFPGYEYKEPAIRYGLNSRELFSRPVSFVGDPLSGTLVVDATGGSIYTNLGGHPIFYRSYLADALAYAPEPSVLPGVGYRDIWSRTHFLPFRAVFYDVFDWASCTSCPGQEQHAALNVTFGLRADTDRDGQRDDPVLRVPTRLDRTDLDILIKSRNLGYAVDWNENLIDEGIFRGLGYRIEPRYGDPNASREERWRDSYQSNLSTMVGYTETVGHDHLLFQQDLPPGATNLITIQAEILPYEGVPKEGMMKLHQGARLTYRQQWAGPNRYEVYDTHVQGAVGERSDAQVRKEVAPIEVSTYGDQVCYLFTIDDPYDPRTFSEDPYLLSYGYGDLAATTYVGGVEVREGRGVLLHSQVSPGDWTRVRIEINNNSGFTFTNIVLTPQPPAGVTFTPIYQGEDAVPPIFWDLPFLWAETIPDAWKGVYYYSVTVDANLDPALLGTVQEIPIAISGDNVPADFEISPAVLAIEDAGGQARHAYGQAHDLVLTDWLPDKVRMRPDGVVRVDEAGWDQFQECVALGSDPPDCLTSLSFTQPVSIYTATLGAGTWITFGLSTEDRFMPRADGEPLHLIALADLIWADNGPNVINEGPVITYTDPFDMDWQDQAPPVEVEAHGALIQAQYEAAVGPAAARFLTPGQINMVDVLATACNVGDRKAEDVWITLTLPITVEILDAEPGVIITDHTVIWGGFDLAPGGCSEPVWFLVSTWPDEQSEGSSWTIVSEAWSVFWDEYSAQTINGPAGDAFALPVRRPPGHLYRRYLPFVLKNYRPDWWPTGAEHTP